MRVGRRVVDALRSPRRLGAFAARLGRLIVRGEIGAFVSRIRARGVNADEYRGWKAARARSSTTPVPFLVAVDIDDEVTSRSVAEAFRKRLAQSTPIVARAGAQWIDECGRAPQSLVECVAASGATWLLWIAAPLELEDDALPALSEGCALPGARVVYADHAIVDESGVETPVFLSAWDRVRIAEAPYTAPMLAVRANLASAVEDSRGGAAGQWRLLIDAENSRNDEHIVHVPRVACRVVRRNDPVADARVRAEVVPDLQRLAARHGASIAVDGSVSPWLRYRAPSAATVSVIIPTRDRADLMTRCIDSILCSGWSARNELVVVDNGSTDVRVAELLRSLSLRASVRTLRMDVAFNFPALCNAGVGAAQGSVVVLLNNDAEVSAGWLDELVPLALRSDIGAVGPLLAYPDGRIQSAGVLVGVNRTATSALEGFDARSPTVAAWCTQRRRVSALLGACIAIERSKYLRIGGMDPQFAVSHNEVDFCLRLDAEGLANVFTPFARVLHAEGATRGFEVTAEERLRLDDEEARFVARWAHLLDVADPAHHPALARTGNPFRLASPATAVLRARAGWRSVASAASPGIGPSGG